MKSEKKTPSKRRKTESKSLTVTLPRYKREDIESSLTNVMLCAVTIAAAVLALTLFVAALKH